jgi:hypothetical protein
MLYSLLNIKILYQNHTIMLYSLSNINIYNDNFIFLAITIILGLKSKVNK